MQDCVHHGWSTFSTAGATVWKVPVPLLHGFDALAYQFFCGRSGFKRYNFFIYQVLFIGPKRILDCLVHSYDPTPRCLGAMTGAIEHLSNCFSHTTSGKRFTTKHITVCLTITNSASRVP